MAVPVFTRLPLSHSCCWQCGKILTPIYVTLLRYYYDVLGILGQSLPALVCNHRTHNLLPMRSRYGSWTQNLSHGAAHCWRGNAPPPSRRGVLAGVALSYSWPMACPSLTLPSRSGSAAALSTSGCSGLWRRVQRD